MKKNTLQKLLAVGLVSAMAAGTLAGCGGQTATNSSGSASGSSEQPAQSSESSSAQVEEPAAVAGIEGYTAFENTVTLTIPVYDRGKEGVPAIGTGDNYWEKWLQENFGDKYNIKLEFEPIARGAVLEAYNTLAAAEDLPTFLMEYDYPKQAEWVANGFTATYDLEEFAFIAPTYYQRMVDLDQIQYTTMNGETYFVLAERPFFNTNYMFATWVRMDWLEQVGYDHIPANRKEYVDAMTKIQQAGISAHPAGGAMTSGTAGMDQNYGYRTYPTNEEEWAMYGDYAIPSLGWEPNKKLLKEQNENYQLGFTDPDYYTIDGATAEANFVAGKTYSYSAYISADMPVLKSFYENNPNAKLALCIQNNVADTENGTVPAFRSNNPFGMMISFSSQAKPEEIKAAMMYMEWCTQPENLLTYQWGFEGEHYTKDANGLPVAVADYAGDKKQGFSNNKDYYCVTIEARNAGTIEDVISSMSPKGLPQDFTEDLIKNYYEQVKAWEKGWVPTDCMFATTIESVGEYQGDLLSKYAEYRDKLVMCKPEEFDKLYDELAKQYNEAGYAKITEERLAALKGGLSSRMK